MGQSQTALENMSKKKVCLRIGSPALFHKSSADTCCIFCIHIREQLKYWSTYHNFALKNIAHCGLFKNGYITSTPYSCALYQIVRDILPISRGLIEMLRRSSQVPLWLTPPLGAFRLIGRCVPVAVQ